MNVTLRDYQVKGINDIIDAWKEEQSVLFQMPTGTGKTTLFCEIARRFTTEFYPNKKILIVTHRRELVEQVYTRLVTDFHLPRRYNCCKHFRHSIFSYSDSIYSNTCKKTRTS